MKTVRRTAWTLIAVLALTASSGCSRTGTASSDGAPSRPCGSTGQSLERAQERSASIDGLTDASITQADTVSGLNKRHEVSIEGSVHDSATVPAIIDRVARLGWSVGDVEPDTGAFIRLRTKPQLVLGEVAVRLRAASGVTRSRGGRPLLDPVPRAGVTGSQTAE